MRRRAFPRNARLFIERRQTPAPDRFCIGIGGSSVVFHLRPCRLASRSTAHERTPCSAFGIFGILALRRQGGTDRARACRKGTVQSDSAGNPRRIAFMPDTIDAEGVCPNRRGESADTEGRFRGSPHPPRRGNDQPVEKRKTACAHEDPGGKPSTPRPVPFADGTTCMSCDVHNGSSIRKRGETRRMSRP